MNSDMNWDTNPADDFGAVEESLRHELHGTFVPFDGGRAEEMIRAATGAHMSRLPRLAAPLGTAAAVLALGAGVVVFAANGIGNNPAPAGGGPSSPKPTRPSPCVHSARVVAPAPIRTEPHRGVGVTRVPAFGPTAERTTAVYPPPPPPPGQAPYQSRLSCSTHGQIYICHAVGSLTQMKGRTKFECPDLPPSARVHLPRLTRRPAAPIATPSVGRLRVPPPTAPPSGDIPVPRTTAVLVPPPGPTASGSPARS